MLEENRVQLDRIQALLKRETVKIEVIVGRGDHTETFWGCDLSKGYIDENAFYTT